MAETKELQVQETEKQEIVESDAERTRARACFVPRCPLVIFNTFLWRFRAVTLLLTLGNSPILSLGDPTWLGRPHPPGSG